MLPPSQRTAIGVQSNGPPHWRRPPPTRGRGPMGPRGCTMTPISRGNPHKRRGSPRDGELCPERATRVDAPKTKSGSSPGHATDDVPAVGRPVAAPPSSASATGNPNGPSAGEADMKRVLRKSKSIAEEFYHNKDMKELVTCVRDELDMAKNGPTVISTWLYGTSETLQYKTVHSAPLVAWEETLCAVQPTVPAAPTTSP